LVLATWYCFASAHPYPALIHTFHTPFSITAIPHSDPALIWGAWRVPGWGLIMRRVFGILPARFELPDDPLEVTHTIVLTQMTHCYHC